jgi:tRNA(fMet)-specific endonuclease VapC
VLILDTDHITAINRNAKSCASLIERLDKSGDVIATTIVTAEEQLRGLLAQISRTSDPLRQVETYERLQQRLVFFAEWQVLPWDAEAARQFKDFRSQGLRIGSMDLKIACIAIMHDAMLLSRNLTDFEQVPGLKVQDWL